MPPRAHLSTGTVVATANDLLQSGGEQALTLHNLASRLGVQTPSLYNHVDGMPGLLRELRLLNARLLESRLVDAALGKSGAPALLQLAQAYRAYIMSNPELYNLTLRALRQRIPAGRRAERAGRAHRGDRAGGAGVLRPARRGRPARRAWFAQPCPRICHTGGSRRVRSAAGLR